MFLLMIKFSMNSTHHTDISRSTYQHVAILYTIYHSLYIYLPYMAPNNNLMDAGKDQIDSNTNVLIPTLVFLLPRQTLGSLRLPPRVALRQRKWDLAGEPLSPWSSVPSGPPPPAEQENRN